MTVTGAITDEFGSVSNSFGVEPCRRCHRTAHCASAQSRFTHLFRIAQSDDGGLARSRAGTVVGGTALGDRLTGGRTGGSAGNVGRD